MKAASGFLRTPFSSSSPTLPLLTSLFSTFHHKPNNTIKPNTFTSVPFSSFSSLPSPSPPPTPLSLHHTPKPPLFLNPPTYTTTISNLTTFITFADTLITSISPTFDKLDNGPETHLLKRELRWFLDDAVEDFSSFPHLGISQNEVFTSFPHLGMSQNDEESESDEVVRLRTSLEEMYVLWKQRVEERRPLQYIVGCEHWRDLVLAVEDGVLIPRPETEMVVDLVEGVLECGEEGVWADLGTGSGALAVGIGRLLQKKKKNGGKGKGKGRVVATDLSPVAVSVAKYNVQRYGLQDIVEVRQGSWFDPLLELEGQLAGLVSNPPYIPTEDLKGLQAEVRMHEPKLALDGGIEGLDSLIYLCHQMTTMLKPGGFFAFETNGEKQSKFLVNYLQNERGRSFHDVKAIADFAGILRFVTGYRK